MNPNSDTLRLEDVCDLEFDFGVFSSEELRFQVRAGKSCIFYNQPGFNFEILCFRRLLFICDLGFRFSERKQQKKKSHGRSFHCFFVSFCFCNQEGSQLELHGYKLEIYVFMMQLGGVFFYTAKNCPKTGAGYWKSNCSALFPGNGKAIYHSPEISGCVHAREH